MKSRPVALVIALTLLALTSACGGGGSEDEAGTPAPAPVTIMIAGEAGVDGWAQSDGDGFSFGGGPITGDFDATEPGVGDRQLFSFSLAAIPAGATIVDATLHVTQIGVTGTPYANHGIVVADHVDYGATLTGAAFNQIAFSSAFATVSADATIGVKSVTVKAQVEADLAAARIRTQYRLRFSVLDSDNDGVNDYASFADAEVSSRGVAADAPMLVVTYLP